MQMMRRLYGQLRAAAEADVARTLPVPAAAPALAPHEAHLDAELDEAAQVPSLIINVMVIVKVTIPRSVTELIVR